MTSVFFVLQFLACYGVVQWAIHHYGLKWAEASLISKWTNLLYGVASGVFCAATIEVCVHDKAFMKMISSSEYSISTLLSLDLPANLQPYFKLYFYSKIWEAVDIVLVSLQGFPINLHFRVHHNTTPLLAWALMEHPSVAGVVFMILNTCMHFFVYLYFGGCNGSFFFAMTRLFGHLQLIWGMILSCCYALFSGRAFSKEILVGSCLPFMLYCTYFILFQMEIGDEAKAAAKERKKKLKV